MAAAVALRPATIDREIVLQAYNMDAGAGARYTYALDPPSVPFELTGGRRGDRRSPRIVLKEDGQALGPRLTVVDEAGLREIEAQGGGRHGYLDGVLHFSASDGSDPRTSGRFYHVAYSLALSARALQGLLTIGGLIAVLALLSSWRRR